MSDERSIPEQLRAHADHVARLFREQYDTALTYNQTGVECVDLFINHCREDLGAFDRGIFTRMLAYFVGEAIIRTFGGAWVKKEGEWCVQVNEAIRKFGPVRALAVMRLVALADRKIVEEVH